MQEAGETYDKAVVEQRVKERLAEAEAKGRVMKVWDADDIEADGNTIGGNGSPTKVKNIESVVLAGSDLVKIDATEEGCRRLVKELVEDHILG